MKKYRIKNYRDDGFIVQKRFMLIDWITYCDNKFFSSPKIFNTIEESKIFINEEIKIKKIEYIEYI